MKEIVELLEKRLEMQENLMNKAIQAMEGQGRNIGIITRIVEKQTEMIKDLENRNLTDKYL